ncbi:MAG: lactonase family protein [Verrucomicrobiales bacterium]|nr:lactonase family protein [Verrucomicrobiales bacterium]
MRSRTLIFFLTLASGVHSTLFGQTPDRVYFGTYTRGDSEGIYVSDWDSQSGKLSEPVLAAKMTNPSFLELSEDGGNLYAVSEVGDYEGGGAIHAFRILQDGKLKLINIQPTRGGAACHLSISPNGKIVAVANYTGGNISSFRILADGSLSSPVSVIQHTGSSINPKRQKEPHAHSINFSPNGRFAYAADLGTDRIYCYTVDGETGELFKAGETVIGAGSGPRHFAFRPDGKFAYVINELSLTIDGFAVDPETGELDFIQSVSTLPPQTEPIGSTAEVVCHPSGKFLYGSNRGHDSIVAYQIDPNSGQLSYIENVSIQGETPRNFSISLNGRWLIAAGQKSNTSAVFGINLSTGSLTYVGESQPVQSPVCVRFWESKTPLQTVWQNDGEFDALYFKTTVLTGTFIAHDHRDLGKGYGRHGFRDMTYKGIDLNAPEGPVGAKRRHQGLLNLYRIYGVNETFGALRNDEAEVVPQEDGARLTWPASEARPIAISATYTISGQSQIDVLLEATPTRDIKNFEILPATYLPVEWEKFVYLQGESAPEPTLLRPSGNEDDDLKYPFYSMSKSDRDAQEKSGRTTSTWQWKSILPEPLAALPIVFCGDNKVQVIQFAAPDSVSAVCATPKPEAGDPEEWNSVGQHSALYFSLFGRDVKAGETVSSKIRLLVIDTPDQVAETHRELYDSFLRGTGH